MATDRDLASAKLDGGFARLHVSDPPGLDPDGVQGADDVVVLGVRRQREGAGPTEGTSGSDGTDGSDGTVGGEAAAPKDEEAVEGEFKEV